MRASIRHFFFLCAGAWAFTAQAQVVIVPAATHEYTFDVDFSDTAGGPALQSMGGAISEGHYVFGANQGLSLSNPALSTSTYTMEFQFSFDTIGGYRRIADVKNRASDTGLYALGQSLNFYNVATATAADFVAGQSIHVVLTRLGATQEIIGYVNGQQRFSFTDTGGLGEISGPNKELYFFADDLAVAGESASGSVDFIRLFDESLSAAQVLELYQNGAPVAVPEPSTYVLIVTGLGLLAFNWHRQRRARG